MEYPNLSEEKKLWKSGFNFVAGLDEAGRGPLAGPVVAAAVIISPEFKIKNLKLKINDSKLLSPTAREKLYDIITNHPDIKWGIGIVSEKIIDKINILEATKLAMAKAVMSLRASEASVAIQSSRKNSRLPRRPLAPRNDENYYLLVDGNMKFIWNYKYKSIIKGDQKIFSISAASIIAKVTRDRIMQKYHKKYPQYGFDGHKGYGTKEHFAAIKKFGACKIHRKTFYPITRLCNRARVIHSLTSCFEKR